MIKKLGFIGAGNVAHHLSISLNVSGIELVQVISTRLSSAQVLAQQVNAEYSDSIKEMSREVDLWIMAIPDDAIQSVSDLFPFSPKAVVHTSGSIGMDVLKGKAEEIGVFYPLQTFSKSRSVMMEEVPFCLEAQNQSFYSDLENLARKISSHIYSVSSNERSELHLAAVFACNFTNSMYSIAEELLSKKNLDFEILHPLIKETAQKAIENSPKNVQTGPAIRKDEKTINKHLEKLNRYDYRQLYQLMSEIIRQNTNKK